ncbi:M23 family metallopeptidase [Bacillus alkalicellulosilyticus]|uniref:M23 family metallopeptidase n=1 Tax=Alkalihalobacterium alkalicellulosilyticum TaxID=1912214 RepID=UPI00099620EB|nr:peptidoglycan DD-metalloendopeptidase family protein [Bacillus alkalicellulosilyticus]
MRKIAVVLIALGLVGSCQNNSIPQEEIVDMEHEETANVEVPEVNEFIEELPMEIAADEARFRLEDLIDIVGGTYSYDEVHRTLHVNINNDVYYLVAGVPVLERNGEYLASEDIYLIIDEEEIYLPAAFLTIGMGLQIEYEESAIAFEWRGPTERVGGPPSDFDFLNWTSEDMIEFLSFFEKPIKDAEVSTIASHLPGAVRAYRNGYHEGLDWYGFSSGGEIGHGTPIYGMAKGIVVRADHDFVEYESPEARNEDLMVTALIGETPEYIFDRLRGQQVWIQYPNGIMSRFAHLSGIPEDLKVGDSINAETVIGYLGNSGTSGSVNQDLSELHLHQDILIYGELFWEPLSQDEVRDVLVSIFQ